MLHHYLKLNKNQFEKLSDISSEIGLVALASVILPALLDKFDSRQVLLGSAATLFFWIISIWLRK